MKFNSGPLRMLVKARRRMIEKLIIPTIGPGILNDDKSNGENFKPESRGLNSKSSGEVIRDLSAGSGPN